MSKYAAQCRRVIRFLETLGIECRIEKKDDYFNCPFDWDIGIDWDQKVLYISPERLRTAGASLVAALIHEAGHLVATTERPMGSQEWRFFGWEYVVAKHCQVVKSWLIGHQDYYVPVPGEKDTQELRNVSPANVRAILKERLHEAQSLGLVVDGNPKPER